MKHHIPSGRMTGLGHNLERPPGPLCAPPRARHDSVTGVGEPHPTALPQMEYVCLLDGVDRDASGHVDMCQGVRA